MKLTYIIAALVAFAVSGCVIGRTQRQIEEYDREHQQRLMQF